VLLAFGTWNSMMRPASNSRAILPSLAFTDEKRTCAARCFNRSRYIPNLLNS
jgi:hypothetical protein